MSLFEEVQKKVFGLLGQLPAYLVYHSMAHTTYVIDKAVMIAQAEQVDPEDLLLIKTGALFHDVGFIRQYQDHEEAGCDIAWEILPGYAFDPSSIGDVCSMIMATKPGNIPGTLFEKIVKDADLEYLGTSLFFQNSVLLHEELKHINPELNDIQFRQMQIQFISGHVYYTDFCKTYREEKKREHLFMLQKKTPDN